MPLNSQRLIIQGGNGFGKSAIVKSLYDTFGATPQKIDQSWTSANVSSCLQFELDGAQFTAVKTLGVYAVFDAKGSMLFSGQGLVKEVGPNLAGFLDFQLQMTDKQGRTITPPPAYIFAPFYVDQDIGWTTPWHSFTDFFLSDSARTLAEYHSGLKPDEYYSAKAEMTKARAELAEIESSRAALRETIGQVKEISENAGVIYDIEEFKKEIADIVAETSALRDAQLEYRREITNLHEAIHLARSEHTLLTRTLVEMRGEFETACALPDEVECPTCGQEYTNSLADRFSLIADEGVLTEALSQVTARLRRLTEEESREKDKLRSVERPLSRLESILEARKESVSFRDVLVAEGKTEAARILRRSLESKDAQAYEKASQIDAHKQVMSSFLDKKHTAQVNKFFRSKLAQFAHMLDVRLENPDKQKISSVRVARGSEGPRALLAYYYAFLHTTAEFSSSRFYPIVIDAPNQQGQDSVHLPQMLRFIFENAPPKAQVIVATEDAGSTTFADVDVRTYGERRRQVLRDSEYDRVNATFAPFQQAILASI
ncbi:hypothetical protein [Microvirga massiliensis]|uniref:hypothetical protein n=1 Tax=Microvirga massiliensis TaxID=1033741 RepID=UPI0011C919F8|nr:hypothetical protein [Microvirga massiliensis]